MLLSKKRNIVLLSPLLIILINCVVAIVSGKLIGKWAFIPVILIEWALFMYFILRYGGISSINKWLKKPSGSWGWTVLALFVGIIPLPLFLMHWHLLASWTIWLPWILLALFNPWIEEFYWRALLTDHSGNWPGWLSVIFTSAFFALNHAVFGINSELNSGVTILISTFIMGVVWAIVFKRTGSARWIIFSHFLVDIFNLSAASFLDLYKSGW